MIAYWYSKLEKGVSDRNLRPVRPWPYRFLRKRKCHCLISNLHVCILPHGLSQLQDVPSMTMPFLHFFEASTTQVATRGLGLFHTILMCETSLRNVSRLTCMKFSVACLRMMATFKKRGQFKPFSQPTSHFSIESLEKLLL